MAENGTIAYVDTMPKCDIHQDHDAAYDASINYSGRRTWAYICEGLFQEPSIGAALGTGRGQKLVLRTDDDKEK